MQPLHALVRLIRIARLQYQEYEDFMGEASQWFGRFGLSPSRDSPLSEQLPFATGNRYATTEMPVLPSQLSKKTISDFFKTFFFKDSLHWKIFANWMRTCALCNTIDAATSPSFLEARPQVPQVRFASSPRDFFDPFLEVPLNKVVSQLIARNPRIVVRSQHPGDTFLAEEDAGLCLIEVVVKDQTLTIPLQILLLFPEDRAIQNRFFKTALTQAKNHMERKEKTQIGLFFIDPEIVHEVEIQDCVSKLMKDPATSPGEKEALFSLVW